MPRDLATDFKVALGLDVVAYLHLLELRLPEPVGTLRYAISPSRVQWNGDWYEATNGWWGAVGASTDGRVPDLHLLLQNADGDIGPRLDPRQGGVDARGARVVLRRTLRDFVTAAEPGRAVIEDALLIEDYQFVGRQHIAIHLGLFPMLSIQVPERTLQGLRCTWPYKGPHCGYVGSLPSCDKTAFGVNGCKAHFGEAPMRFGAFWGRAAGRGA